MDDEEAALDKVEKNSKKAKKDAKDVKDQVKPVDPYFPVDDAELEEKLELEPGEYHGGYKETLKTQLKGLLKKHRIKNPDFGWDANNELIMRHPDFPEITIKTGIFAGPKK